MNKINKIISILSICVTLLATAPLQSMDNGKNNQMAQRAENAVKAAQKATQERVNNTQKAARTDASQHAVDDESGALIIGRAEIAAAKTAQERAAANTQNNNPSTLQRALAYLGLTSK